MVLSGKSVFGWLTEKGKAFRSITVLSMVLLPFVGSLLVLPAARAQTNSSGRDCDSNAVINCGALTVNELQRKYKNSNDTQAIYNSFGISSSDIRAMDKNTASGTVTKSGKVIVNGNTVATNAMTAGRQNINGSHRHNSGGTTFYTRSPNVSFQQSSLSAFVVMKNNQFQFAIIKSCGNPVKATSVVKKVTKKKQRVTHNVTQHVTKVVTPAPPAQIQSQSQSQSVVVKAPPTTVTVAPTPQPAPSPAPQPTPTQIPNTGAGDVVGFGSFVTLVGGSLHYLYRRRFSS